MSSAAHGRPHLFRNLPLSGFSQHGERGTIGVNNLLNVVPQQRCSRKSNPRALSSESNNVFSLRRYTMQSVNLVPLRAAELYLIAPTLPCRLLQICMHTKLLHSSRCRGYHSVLKSFHDHNGHRMSSVMAAYLHGEHGERVIIVNYYLIV